MEEFPNMVLFAMCHWQWWRLTRKHPERKSWSKANRTAQVLRQSVFSPWFLFCINRHIMIYRRIMPVLANVWARLSRTCSRSSRSCTAELECDLDNGDISPLHRLGREGHETVISFLLRRAPRLRLRVKKDIAKRDNPRQAEHPDSYNLCLALLLTEALLRCSPSCPHERATCGA